MRLPQADRISRLRYSVDQRGEDLSEAFHNEIAEILD
jgi:hypothetical protein